MPPAQSARRLLIAETIAVGSELLVGGRSDSNSLFITEALGRIGIEVRFKSIVGDDLADMVQVVKTAVGRAGIVILTGGLGPTVDDCTRDAIARATGKRLAKRKDAFDGMVARLAQWGRTPNPGQLQQALIPAGATVIANPVGSAPGFSLSWKGATVVALPGVPREMEAMMTESIIPLLTEQLAAKRLRPAPIVRQVLHTWGLPEADVDAKLKGMMPPGAPIDLGMLASPMGVLVSLTTKPGKKALPPDLLSSLVQDVRTRLGEWLYGEGRDTMEEVVGKLLANQRRTVALAESCTGGLIGHRLTQVPGSSAYVDRGVVCYSNRAKIEMLGVPEALIAKHGAVSQEVAAAMAKAGGSAQLRVYDDLSHNDLVMAMTAPLGFKGPILPEMTEFLRAVTARQLRAEPSPQP